VTIGVIYGLKIISGQKKGPQITLPIAIGMDTDFSIILSALAYGEMATPALGGLAKSYLLLKDGTDQDPK